MPTQALRRVASNPHAQQFIKFVIVGALTTLVNFAIYATLVLVGVFYLYAAVIAFVVATLNSYTFNRRWTFRAGRHSRGKLFRFTLVQLVGLGVNLGVLAILVENLGFGHHKLIAQVIANAFVVLTNFLGNKFWTFR